MNKKWETLDQKKIDIKETTTPKINKIEALDINEIRGAIKETFVETNKNQGRIGKNEENIGKNQEDIGKNQENIGKNKKGIIEVNSKTDQNAKNILDNHSKITNIEWVDKKQANDINLIFHKIGQMQDDNETSTGNEGTYYEKIQFLATDLKTSVTTDAKIIKQISPTEHKIFKGVSAGLAVFGYISLNKSSKGEVTFRLLKDNIKVSEDIIYELNGKDNHIILNFKNHVFIDDKKDHIYKIQKLSPEGSWFDINGIYLAYSINNSGTGIGSEVTKVYVDQGDKDNKTEIDKLEKNKFKIFTDIDNNMSTIVFDDFSFKVNGSGQLYVTEVWNKDIEGKNLVIFVNKTRKMFENYLKFQSFIGTNFSFNNSNEQNFIDNFSNLGKNSELKLKITSSYYIDIQNVSEIDINLKLYNDIVFLVGEPIAARFYNQYSWIRSNQIQQLIGTNTFFWTIDTTNINNFVFNYNAFILNNENFDLNPKDIAVSYRFNFTTIELIGIK